VKIQHIEVIEINLRCPKPQRNFCCRIASHRHVWNNIYQRTLHWFTQHQLSTSGRQIQQESHGQAKTRILCMQFEGCTPDYCDNPRETRKSEKDAKHGTNSSVSRGHGAVRKSRGSIPQLHTISGLHMGMAIP
jgi:hypothetical protein